MRRYNKGRGRGADRTGAPGMPTVEHAELSNRHLGLRIAAVIIILAIGIGAIVYGLSQLLTTDSGWQEITASTSGGMSCADQFTLNYDLGAAGVSAGTEKRAITELYSEVCERDWQIFNIDEHVDGVVNLYDINHQPNTVLTVDDVLYRALEMLVEEENSGEAGSFRLMYYGPLNETLSNLFTCDTDSQAKAFDPEYDADTAAYFAGVLSYANDTDAVELELLGDGQVRLYVAEEYLAFGEEYGIENYIDLSVMANAFILDDAADTLIDAGYTLGTLSSYDGYSRCLDDGTMGAAFRIYDRIGEAAGTESSDSEETSGSTAVCAATVTAAGVNTVVSLRDFPLEERDIYRFYTYADGTVRSLYLGNDGQCHTVLPDLTVCSCGGSCAGLLLCILPDYIQDTWDAAKDAELAAEGIWSVYCRDSRIISGIPNAEFTDLYDRDGVTYTLE